MRILLTGPSGFLGSALVRHWARCGHELTLIARAHSQLKRVESVLHLPEVRVVRVTTPEEVVAAVHVAAPDAIVHTASTYGREGETALDLIGANLVLGTALLQAVLNVSISRKGPISVLNAGTALPPSVSLYALSKAQFSSLGAALAAHSPHRLRFINLRLQQMYGPGDDLSKFTSRVIETLRSNAPRLALTPGEQRRDFIYIDDVVHAYDCILERLDQFSESDAIDVGSGNAITMRSFVELAKHVTGAETVLDFGAVQYRVAEAMLCVADTMRLRSLGWKSATPLAVGLRETIGLGAET
jgi:CDP-paratose synthetase